MSDKVLNSWGNVVVLVYTKRIPFDLSQHRFRLHIDSKPQTNIRTCLCHSISSFNLEYFSFFIGLLSWSYTLLAHPPMIWPCWLTQMQTHTFLNSHCAATFSTVTVIRSNLLCETQPLFYPMEAWNEILLIPAAQLGWLADSQRRQHWKG